MLLQNIFDSITPDNIKKIPLLKDAMEIFIETINEQNDITIDIANIYDEKYKVIREEFIKIYLNDLYRYFTAAKSNTLIANKIESNNSLGYEDYMNPDFVGDLTELFTDEHFVMSKAFKQKKGTKVGIEYVYNIVESLLYEESQRGNFTFIEGDVPFEFEIAGTLYKEIYNEIVRPIAHPLGFLIDYEQIFALNLKDYFKLETQYNDVIIEVNCLSGSKEVYVNNDDITAMYLESNIVEIIDQDDESGKYKKVTFSDGRYLESFFDPIDVTFKEADHTIVINYDIGETLLDPADENDRYYNYVYHCSMLLSYTSKLVSTIDDTYLSIEYGSGLEDTFVPTDLDVYEIDFDSRIQFNYDINGEYIGFVVNESEVGQTGDKGIVGLYDSDTVSDSRFATDVHDLRNEVSEQLNIDIIPG